MGPSGTFETIVRTMRSRHGPEIRIDARPRIAESDDRDLRSLGRWDTPDERTSRIDLCGCVGQLERDRLVHDDRLAASHALLGVIQSDLVGAPCDTQRLRPAPRRERPDRLART